LRLLAEDDAYSRGSRAPHHNESFPPERSHERILAFAKSLKKDRNMIRQMKLETHKELLKVIDETIASLAYE
jgi:hypothetical protein